MWLDPDWGAQGGTPRSLELSFCSGKGSRDGRGQEEPGWQTLEVARRVRLLRFKFMLPHLLAVALISLGPNISGPHFHHSGPDNISTAKGWCTPSRNTKFRCCHWQQWDARASSSPWASVSPSVKWGHPCLIGGLNGTLFEKILAPRGHLVNPQDGGAPLSFHVACLVNFCQHLLPPGNQHGKWDANPINCSSRNELRNQAFVCFRLTHPHHWALEPHEPTSFCLRGRDGLVWDEGGFCFTLLYKQKHSLVSPLKGWEGSWVRWGVVNVKSVTLPSPRIWRTQVSPHWPAQPPMHMGSVFLLVHLLTWRNRSILLECSTE